MTAVVYRYGHTFGLRGERVLYLRGYKPAWLMRLLMLLPMTYDDAQ